MNEDAQTVAAAAEAVIKQIDPRIARMELAILGDGAVGHDGLIARVRLLEASDREVDDRRRAGETRLDERINKVERKMDRFLWIAAGIGLGSGGAGAYLASLFA